MSFDLELAIAVREREDGLLERDTFDLSTAQPTEASYTSGPNRYSPPLSPEQKAQAVVALSYREKGEQVPLGLKADWVLSSPTAKMITSNILGALLTGGIVPAYNALKGIANAASPNSDVGKMIFDSAYKGLAENQEVENLGGAAAKAYPNAPWVITGTMGAVAEMLILAPGIIKGGATLASKTEQYKIALNNLRASPKYGDLIGKISEKTNIPVEQVELEISRKVWSLKDKVNYFRICKKF